MKTKAKNINLSSLFILLLLIVGVVFRFYNLGWGSPFFFHPDERNIASAVTQLQFPNEMNPHFFAYGSLPIYVIYLLGVVINSIASLFNIVPIEQIFHVSFEMAIFASRIFSAFLSILTVLLTYKVASFYKGRYTKFLAFAFSLLSVGYLQYAHFGTFEMWLTFFTLLLFYSQLIFIKNNSEKHFLLSTLLVGILISIKISSVALLPIIFLVAAIQELKNKVKLTHALLRIFAYLILLCSVVLLVVFTTSPYIFLDFSSFISSITYETNVATGSLPVFYTAGFIDSQPLLFQALKVYPFLLNPILAILFIPACIVFFWNAIEQREKRMILLIIFLLALILSQYFLYVKWIRYYVPTLPFIYIILSWGISSIIERFKKYSFFAVGILCCISFFYGTLYFSTVTLPTDSRVAASEWSTHNISRDAYILSEVYDLGITPFNARFKNIELFNFYDLDHVPTLSEELKKTIDTYQIIILPSQRIYKNRTLYPEKFSVSSVFYKELFSGRLGYRKIYETRCSVFCKILYGGSPVFSYEETANVFDRPQFYIFEKIK